MEFVLYIALILAMVLALFAQIKVSNTFNRYSRVATRQGRCAEEVARMMLHAEGVHDVRIERVHGRLSDHYDPRSKTLRLSDGVYGNASAAAIGVACHEAGHAIQHARAYAPLKLRSALVPVTSFASRVWWIIVLLGSLLIGVGGYLGQSTLGLTVVYAGIALFAFTTLFQLITLPCELDASNRAMRAMRQTGYFESSELVGARRVLSAAALTYVAAAVVSLVQLLRLVMIFGRRDR